MNLTKEFRKIKTVKKTTYNSLTNQVHLKINLERGPFQKEFVNRSQSFKNVIRFVPTLKPKKSTFMPTPLNLDNIINEKEEEKSDFDKQKSDDEIQIIDDEDNSSFLSGSSSEVENSIDENIKREKVKEKEKLTKNGGIFKMSSTDVFENKESKDIANNNIDFDAFEINDIKDNEDNKSMKIFRRKMSQIRVKAGINKYKETEDTINDNFKKNYNIGLKIIEKKYESDLYSSKKYLDFNKNENENPKVKTIFEVLSISKKGTMNKI